VGTYFITSCAADASIFGVDTIVNAVVGAVNQSALSVSTSEIIQEDGDSSLAKASTTVCNCICSSHIITTTDGVIIITGMHGVKTRRISIARCVLLQ